MARRKRKKVFTFMLVPDQAQDPRSYSLSYATGRIMLAAGFLLCVHIGLGVYSYFRSAQLRRSNIQLVSENASLKAQVQKIDEIFSVMQDVDELKEKILTGFGTVLGVSNENVGSSDLSEPLNGIDMTQLSSGDEPLYKMQNSISFLEDRGGRSYNPTFWPNRLPVEGFLTTHFQEGGWLLGRSHYGIDIAAAQGTQIRAAGAGIVVMADWTPDFGNVVLISHGNGVYTYYAHTLRVLVHKGWRVRKGQIIALLGSSGISSAPHLHFEIWKDGKPLDPSKVLIAMGRSAGL